MELASTQQAAHTSSHACLSSESGDNFHIISSERTFCSFPASGWAKLELCCASFRAESKKVTFQAQHKERGGIWVSRDPSAKKAPGQLQNITTSMRAPPSPATPKKTPWKEKTLNNKFENMRAEPYLADLIERFLSVSSCVFEVIMSRKCTMDISSNYTLLCRVLNRKTKTRVDYSCKNFFSIMQNTIYRKI